MEQHRTRRLSIHAIRLRTVAGYRLQRLALHVVQRERPGREDRAARKRVAPLRMRRDAHHALRCKRAQGRGRRRELAAELLQPSAAHPRDVAEKFALIGREPGIRRTGDRLDEQALLRLRVRLQHCGRNGGPEAYLDWRAGVRGYPPYEPQHLWREERCLVRNAKDRLDPVRRRGAVATLDGKGEAPRLAMPERHAQHLPHPDPTRQFDRHFIGEEPVEGKVYGDLYVHTIIRRRGTAGQGRHRSCTAAC